MDKFWEYFGQSLILQGILTVMVVGTVCYLYITTLGCPDGLLAVAGIIVGYFFKAKGSTQIIERQYMPTEED